MRDRAFTAAGSGLRHSTTAALSLLVLLTVVLISLQTVALNVALAALALIWVSAVPALLYLQWIDAGAIPLLPYVGAYYVVFFGLPVFAAPLASHLGDKLVVYHVVLDPIRPATIALATAGAAALILGFYLAKGTVLRRLQRFQLGGAEPSPSALNTLYWVLIIASLAYRHISALHVVPSIGQFLEPVGFLALGGFFLQWRRGRLPRVQALAVLFLCLPLDLYARLRFFYLTDLLFLPLFFTFVLWRERLFKSIAALAVAGALALFAYSATTATRYAGHSVLEKAVAAFDYARAAIRDRTPEGRPLVVNGERLGEVTFDRRISPLVNRLGQIWMFQAVHDRSPDPVPYLAGETYRPLFTSFIPRIVYPSKPEERAGGRFGLHFGFVHDPDEQTSINIPWLVELLANFGPPGVVIGMAVFGGLLAVADKLFNSPGASDLEFLIGLTIIFRLGYQESNFSQMTGSLLPLFVALYVYFRFGGWILGRMRPAER